MAYYLNKRKQVNKTKWKFQDISFLVLFQICFRRIVGDRKSLKTMMWFTIRFYLMFAPLHLMTISHTILVFDMWLTSSFSPCILTMTKSCHVFPWIIPNLCYLLCAQQTHLLSSSFLVLLLQPAHLKTSQILVLNTFHHQLLQSASDENVFLIFFFLFNCHNLFMGLTSILKHIHALFDKFL